MDRNAWQRAKDLFTAAMDRPAADRASFVAEACSDAGIREDALRMLRFHEHSSDFLLSPVTSPPGDAPAADPLIGSDVGGFVLRRRIGMGGMGAVYEADQEQPKRSAAVKLLRPEIFSTRARRRFDYECEFLARLTHEGIAKIYAAGEAGLGGVVRPWFAMELIEGPTLRGFIRERAVSHRAKLELLALICDAVQHAHQHGVIHRDLKPDNILISRTGASGDSLQPKILDFGVARSIEPGVQATMQTAAGELVGTVAYMSPEQFVGDPAKVDTRTDVYSIGVIGYEMLCGKPPLGAESSCFAEMIRAIENDEPRRLGAMDPALRGDVEIIIAKALEKDASRRYQSAAELASDLRRYLRSEPISARPTTAIYRMRKFARRNKTLVGGVVATFIALLVGMLLVAREAGIARREAAQSRYEAEKATAINNFITNDFLMKLLAAANSPNAGERIPITQLVDQAAGEIGAVFAGQPLAEAAVTNEIATIYYNLNQMDDAAAGFERALALWEAQLGASHLDTLKAVNNLGQARMRQQRVAEAETLYRRALQGRLAALGEDNPFTLASMNNLGELYRATGRLDEAEVMLRRTLELQQRVHGPMHKHTATTMANLGSLLMQRERVDEAIELYRRAYDASRTTHGSDHVMTAMTGVRLASALQRRGRWREAEPVLMPAVQTFENALGADNPATMQARLLLGRLYRKQARLAEAAEQLEHALSSAQTDPQRFAKLTEQIETELTRVERAKRVSNEEANGKTPR